MASGNFDTTKRDSQYNAYYRLSWSSTKTSPGVTRIDWTLYAKGRSSSPTLLYNSVSVSINGTNVYSQGRWDGTEYTSFKDYTRASGSLSISHTAEKNVALSITYSIYTYAEYTDTGTASIPSNYAPTIDINWEKNGVKAYSGCDVAKFSGWYNSTSSSSNNGGSTFSGATDLGVTCWPSRYYRLVATMNDSSLWTCSNSPITGHVAASSNDKSSVFFQFWSKYTVSYNGNGSTSGSTSDSSHRYGTRKNLNANGFSRTGYTFAGWNTKSNGTGTSYYNQQEVVNLTTTPGGTVTLYAQWSAISYKLSFDANGGTNTPGGNFALTSPPTEYGEEVSWVTVTYNSGNFSNMSGNIPTRPGYKFLGWYTRATGGTQIYDALGYSTNNGTYWNNSGQWVSTRDRTVYAHWEVMSQTFLKAPQEGFIRVQPHVWKDGAWHPAQTMRRNGNNWDLS